LAGLAGWAGWAGWAGLGWLPVLDFRFYISSFILHVLISGFSFQVSAFDFSFIFRVLELCSKFWNSLAASALLRGLAMGCFIFLVEHSWNFSLDILRTLALGSLAYDL
jgi:hypothetical protein